MQEGLPACVQNEAVEALLAGSKIRNLPGRQSALKLAAEITENESPEYLRAAVALRQSILSRFAAKYDASERVIKDFCNRLWPFPGNQRLHSLHGRLYVSHLENMVQRGDLETALAELNGWNVLENASLMELRVLPSKVMAEAKLLRSQARFAEVKESLTGCLEALHPWDEIRWSVVCSLADAYCDLGRPIDADEIVKPEIETQRARGMQGKSFRRLLVSAIDADLGQRRYEKAERTVQQAKPIFSRLSDLDVSDQLLHMRVLLASARIFYYKSQLPRALRALDVALLYVWKYESFKKEGFTFAIVQLSTCLVHLELGNVNAGWKAFEIAELVLRREMRDYWMPTLTTFWLEFVSTKIKSMTGWTVPEG